MERSKLSAYLPVLCCGASTKIFARLLKIPISLLKKLNVFRKMFLGNILIMVSSIEEMVLARDTLIFLLQDLIFFINRKKTVFQSRDVIQSIGMEIDSVNMILDLPQVKKKFNSINLY